MSEPEIGIYGKLPAHGDFLQRQLPSKTVIAWDAWLQSFVGSTKELLGESWLDIYLTSPIWRFCFSDGVLDEHQWAGVLLPSVDRVGRYFPFSVMCKLPREESLMSFISGDAAWYESVEDVALKALDGQLQIEALLQQLQLLLPKPSHSYTRQSSPNVAAGLVVDMKLDNPQVKDTLPHFMDAFVSSSLTSFSVWSTHGSERVEPCTFVSSGLPDSSGAPAMLDGMWEDWQWSVPVRPSN